MAMDMGSELEKQNVQIDRITDKVKIYILTLLTNSLCNQSLKSFH